MILLQVTILFLSLLICIVSTGPVSYQYFSFVRSGRSKTNEVPARRSRSFRFSKNQALLENNFWNDEDIIPLSNSLTFEENRGHITPDFSNGLEYPDPYLLTGRAARRAVSVLYRKPLFFSDVSHVELLLRKQDERVANGLAGNNLGSLRPRSPFYRFKKQNSFFK